MLSTPNSQTTEESSPAALFELEDNYSVAWDAFVDSHPSGSIFHLLCWRRTIEKTYNYPAKYFYAKRGEKWTGVLPSFVVGAPPFPRALVSVPVAVGGGILAEDAQTAALLRGAAREYAQKENLEYVEYKTETPLFDDLPTKDGLYYRFEQELFGDRDKQLKAIPRKTRAVVRTGQKAKLQGSYTKDVLDPFYDLYTLSLRALGTPTFPKSLFRNALDECRSDFVCVREAGRIIGVVMNFYYKDTMMPFFAGTLPEARNVGVNNYLYWHMLETGYDLGYRTFDFGRSKANTGAFKFKKNMGMDPIELRYQYELLKLSELPQVNPNNPKYERAIQLWRKLPLFATQKLGPLLQRRIP